MFNWQINESAVLRKIHWLHYAPSFHLSLSSFHLQYQLYEGKKLTKKVSKTCSRGVNKPWLAFLLHHKRIKLLAHMYTIHLNLYNYGYIMITFKNYVKCACFTSKLTFLKFSQHYWIPFACKQHQLQPYQNEYYKQSPTVHS